MTYPVKMYRQPRLRSPSLVLGWSDAGLVGMRAADYLIEKLKAKEFGHIEPCDFYTAPHSVIKGGVLEAIEFPRTVFYYWKRKTATSDLIIYGGSPPVERPYEFASLLVDVAEHFAVERIYTLGGVNASTSHNDAPSVFAVVNNPQLIPVIRDCNLPSGGDYHGPSSMNGIVLAIAKERGIDGISLWARVPNYIGSVPNPRASLAVLRALMSLLGIDVDFNELESEVQFAEKQIVELVDYVRQRNPDFNQYMEKLEKGTDIETLAVDKETFFQEIERFLEEQRELGESDTD